MQHKEITQLSDQPCSITEKPFQKCLFNLRLELNYFMFRKFEYLVPSTVLDAKIARFTSWIIFLY